MKITKILSFAIAAVLLLSLASQPAVAATIAELFLADLDAVEQKYVGLAEAIPADKYGWRPGEGVRSVSEVFTHVASANYMIPSMIGIEPPEGDIRGMEKNVTAKAEVTAKIKESFAHLRQGVKGIPAGDIDKPIKMFGRDSTTGGALMLIINHMHEHLGQMIAYARVNGVVPPWSK